MARARLVKPDVESAQEDSLCERSKNAGRNIK